MRKIINISVPESMKEYVDHRVADGEYGSISEYFRELIRLDRYEDQIQRQAVARRFGLRGKNPELMLPRRSER